MSDQQAQMTNAKPWYEQRIADLDRQVEMAKYTEAELRSLARRFEDEKAMRRRTEEQLAEVKSKLAALQWQRITPENLPPLDLNQELGKWMVNFGGWWRTESGCESADLDGYKDGGWTHFRSINPPAQEAQSNE